MTSRQSNAHNSGFHACSRPFERHCHSAAQSQLPSLTFPLLSNNQVPLWRLTSLSDASQSSPVSHLLPVSGSDENRTKTICWEGGKGVLV